MSLCVSDALAARISTRAFLPTAVPRSTVETILEKAARSPSGGNVQPWRVDIVAGAAREEIINAVAARMAEDPFADEGPFHVYPPKLHEPFRTRRYELGEAMYALLGIPREDKPARLAHMARNYRFFDAPVGLFFSLDKRFGPPQFAHLGMFMLAIALVAEEAGLATCMQEAWTHRAETVTRALNLPDDVQLYCGMALGHADQDAAVNRLQSERAPVADFATFRGFED